MSYRNDHAPLPRIPALPGLPPIRPPRLRVGAPPEFSETQGWEELHKRLKAERRRLGTNRESEESKPASSSSIVGAVASMWAVLIVLSAVVLAIVG